MKDLDALIELLRALVDGDDQAAQAAAALLGMGDEELEALRADVSRSPITEEEIEQLLERVAAQVRAELASRPAERQAEVDDGGDAWLDDEGAGMPNEEGDK